MPTLEVHQFPCLSDNYGYLIHDPKNGVTASIDTPEVAAVNAALTEKKWKLTHILNTHGSLQLFCSGKIYFLGNVSVVNLQLEISSPA